MLYDYDLVILGQSAAAAAAAELAGRQRSRVAWINPPLSENQAQAERAWRGFHILRELLLQRSSLLNHDPDHNPDFALGREPERNRQNNQSAFSVELAELRAMAQLSTPWLQPRNLARWGVDEVAQPGRLMGDRSTPIPQNNPLIWVGRGAEFGDGERLPGGDRSLRGRRYLLAPTAEPQLPTFAQQSAVPIDTLHSWIDWPRWPESVAILGALPEGLALAQLLALVGCRVTLLLPTSPRARAQDSASPPPPMVLSLLAAAGVEVVSEVIVATLRLQPPSAPSSAGSPACNAEAALTLQGERLPTRLSNEVSRESTRESTREPGRQLSRGSNPEFSYAVNRLLVATAWQPQLDSLNLGAVGLQLPLRVDARLRTVNRRVYAVGGAIAGNGRDAEAIYQAKAAAQHALWSPWLGAPLRSPPPHLIWTLPPQVQIGLDAATAEQRYPGRIRRLRSEAAHSWRMQLSRWPIGFCELVVHRSGRLLGATLVATEAAEWGGAIALALQQRLSVTQLAELPQISPSFAQLLSEAALQFRWQQLAAQPRRADLLERFFNWRRTGGI